MDSSRRGLAGTHERHPDVGIWLSHFKDGKWSAPVEVANGVESETLRYPTWNPVLFQPQVGPLMLFYKVGPSPSEWWGMVMTSTDGGHTWSKAERLAGWYFGADQKQTRSTGRWDDYCPFEHRACRLAGAF